MIEERVLVPQRWRSGLAALRLLLSIAGVLVSFRSEDPYSLYIRLALLLFVVYSSVVLWSPKVAKRSYSGSGVAVDAGLCLALAAVRGGGGHLLCLLAFAFLMANAMLFHRPAWLLGSAGTVIPFVLLLRPGEAGRAVPALATAVALALVGCRHRQTLVNRLIASAQQAALFRTESEKAREAERERISGDFHDGPLQSFVSFQMRLEIIRKLLEREVSAAMAELVRLQELTRSQLAEMRAFVRSLRPVELDRAGLGAAAGRLVHSFETESGISARFYKNGEVNIENPDKSREVLKIIREGLHNAHKHSGASQVSVELGTSDGLVEVAIQDDGTGFPFAGRYTLEELDWLGLGPKSIKRRVRALRGDLSVDSRPGMGADLRVRIPA